MDSLYRRTGLATGDYWPHYFRRQVKKDGGLAFAKRLLDPARKFSAGFDKLVAARRADLSVEAIATKAEFRHLFTKEELAEAERRLAELPPAAFPRSKSVMLAFPEEIPEAGFAEGARRVVHVNAYERSQAARTACVKHHGAACCVCGLVFSERYGSIGEQFIHVHHLRPLASLKKGYRVNPKTDLVPVCPNCHAMLHRTDPPLDVEDLRGRLRASD